MSVGGGIDDRTGTTDGVCVHGQPLVVDTVRGSDWNSKTRLTYILAYNRSYLILLKFHRERKT